MSVINFPINREIFNLFFLNKMATTSRWFVAEEFQSFIFCMQPKWRQIKIIRATGFFRNLSLCIVSLLLCNDIKEEQNYALHSTMLIESLFDEIRWNKYHQYECYMLSYAKHSDKNGKFYVTYLIFTYYFLSSLRQRQ